jgi:hypothetical protein
MAEVMPAAAELDGVLKPIGILKLPKDWPPPEAAPEPTADLNGHHAPKLLDGKQSVATKITGMVVLETPVTGRGDLLFQFFFFFCNVPFIT